MAMYYSFKKVGKLTWQESGCWDKSKKSNAEILLLELSKKYSNAFLKIYNVSPLSDYHGYRYVKNKNGNYVSIFITFKNRADEVEFILREV
jgi:hypothetical protein